jgi:hypothetical protein
MAQLLQYPGDFRGAYRGCPLALHLKHDLAQALHGDIHLPLATALAPVPVEIGPMQKTTPATASRASALFELKVQRPGYGFRLA